MVGAHQRAAPGHKVPQFLGESGPQQIQHGRHHQFVPGKVAGLIHHVHGHAQAPQGLVVGQHLLFVVQPQVPGALGVLHGPLVFPIVEHRHLGMHLAAAYGVQLLQQPAHLCHILELPGVGAAVVVHHGPVEFLKGAPAFPELEILHGVGPMGHRL